MSEAVTMFLKIYWANEGLKQLPNLICFDLPALRQESELTNVIANKDFDRIKAGADPENLGSTRVLEKAGFQKSEYKKDFYERGIYKDVRKSDLQFFFLMRPSS
jgi:hypothetical protein